MSNDVEVVGHVPPGSDPVEYDRVRRRVLWRLPTGLYVLGSRRGEERHLMTCSLVTQLSVVPKVVGVSVERGSHTWELVHGTRRFALSLLLRADRTLVRRFVKRAEHDRAARTIGGAPYLDAPETGSPLLAAAAAYLDCRVVEELHLGSHTLFAGEVLAAGFGEGGEEADLLRMEDTRMSYGG